MRDLVRAREYDDMKARIQAESGQAVDVLARFDCVESSGDRLLALLEYPEGDCLPEVTTIGAAGRSAFCRELRVPTDFFGRCPVDLQGVIFGRLLDQSARDWRVRIAGEEIQDLLPPSFTLVRHSAVLEAAEEGLLQVTPEVLPQRVMLTPTELRVSYVVRGREIEARDGDVIRGGIEISNSETRGGALAVHGFLYRLVCSNGLIAKTARDAHSLSHKGPADELIAQFRANVAFQAQRVWEHLERIPATVERAIHDIPAELRALQREFRLPLEIVRRLGNLLEESGDHTVYGVINALTRLAQATDIEYQQARMLEAVAGMLIARTEQGSFCPVCGRAL
jgi:hypothetical protein